MTNVSVVDCKIPQYIQTQHFSLLLVFDRFDAQHIPRITGSKERFHERVIITVTLSALTSLYFILLQQRQIALTRVLASSIRVMHQTSSWPPLGERHFYRECSPIARLVPCSSPSQLHTASRYRPLLLDTAIRSRVPIPVISATHLVLGAAAVKSRWSRFAATGLVC